MTIPFGRTTAALRGAGGEAAALAHHLLRYPTGVGGNRTVAAVCPARPVTAPPHHGPVLLLHGLVDNRAVFGPLLRHLHRHGWTHLHALNHSPLTADVRAAAVLLARHVEWAARAHDGRPVTLIGHSLGGLIARYYVQRLGGAGLAPHVVTLATPHEGTAVARLPALLPITRQLRPGSDLLVELRRPAPGCTARFTALAAELDEVVVPRRSAWIRHPDLPSDNLMVPGVGHLALPAHPLALDLVRHALSGPELTERHAC
ncbi:esterase/lipase family protein [Kitasatospora terrestris]|uniref:AB hydrolase-1 domain-containing protein n=1 Tax=Kitasatospora terrestris TaxID=258051 RepID=A0ABP9DQ55_9ACTN